MKKSLFVLFLYSSLLTASEIAYRFVFGIIALYSELKPYRLQKWRKRLH